MSETTKKFGHITVMKDQMGYFTDHQMDLIIANAPSKEYELLFRILRHGRRITEVLGRPKYLHRWNDINTGEYRTKEYPPVLGITPADFDMETESIRFRILKKHSKDEQEEVFPIETTTYSDLKQYINDKGIKKDEVIFKMNRFQANYQLKKICDNLQIYRVGRQKPHLHNFRHSFAVHFLRNSTDPTDIKKLQLALSHSDINVTSSYLKLGKESLRDNINKTVGRKQNGQENMD